ARPIVSGSHLDTQPTGGNFDGVFGVLAALEVLEAVDDAGVETVHPLELAIWTNEEGARFQPTTMGSAVFAGALALAALLAAVDMVRALRDLMLDATDTARFTVGRFEVRPNSPNTVPGQVLFTIDFRHPDGTVLSRLGDEVAAVCRAHAGGCAVDVIETLNSPPTEFDPRICELIQAAAARQGLPHMRIVSGATHDAKYMAGLCPTGMIFVPCERD